MPQSSTLKTICMTDNEYAATVDTVINTGLLDSGIPRFCRKSKLNQERIHSYIGNIYFKSKTAGDKLVDNIL